jgi:hypothetical protein
MRAISAALAAAVVLIGIGAVAAGAAQPHQISSGVYADPNTPAGKEYALQLQQARSTGAAPSSTGSSGATPLFGAGIARTTPAPQKAARQPATARRKKSSRAKHSTRRPAAAVPRSSGGDGPAAPPPTGSGGGGGGTLALVGGAAAVLALGGLGGVILRRRRSFEPSSD